MFIGKGRFVPQNVPPRAPQAGRLSDKECCARGRMGLFAQKSSFPTGPLQRTRSLGFQAGFGCESFRPLTRTLRRLGLTLPSATISNRCKPCKEGKVIEFNALCRIDTPVEIEYYRNGGILHNVLRNILKKG